jgi:hypothetical protein
MLGINFKSNGLQISIVILIILLIICHTTKIYLDRFADTNTPIETTTSTSYNDISYSDISKQPRRACATATTKPALPYCQPVPKCTQPVACQPTPTCPPPKKGLELLSDAELAVLYKLAYENAGREVMRREVIKQ